MLYTSETEMSIGASPNSSLRLPFQGDLDEVAIYQHRLSSAQVAAHFAAGE